MNGWFFGGSVLLVLGVQFAVATEVFRYEPKQFSFGFLVTHFLGLGSGALFYGAFRGSFEVGAFKPVPFYIATGVGAVAFSLLHGVVRRRVRLVLSSPRRRNRREGDGVTGPKDVPPDSP